MTVNWDKILSHLQNPSGMSQNVYGPLTYEPEQYIIPESPDEPRPMAGLDPEWEANYTTDVELGPDGQELPLGATAWTADGLPFFGEGFEAWGNKLKWSWNKKNVASADEFDEYQKNRDEYLQAREDHDFGGMLKNWGEGWGNLLRGAIGGKEDPETGEIAPTAFQIPGRAIAIGLEGAFDVAIAAGDEMAAQLVGSQEGVREIAEQSRLGPLLGEGFQEKVEEVEEERARRLAPEQDDTNLDKFVKNTTKWFYGFAEAFPFSPSLIWDAVRAVEAPISSKDKKQIMDNNVQAGKIAASAWIDVALKEEFIRRYEAGENPHLLRDELQNPIAEGVLEAIVDPLNYLGPVLSLIRGAKVLKISSVVDEVSDLGKAVNALGDVVTSSQWDTVVDAKIAANALVDGRTATTQAAKGISARTATTKQTQIASTFGDFVGPLSTMMFKGEPGKAVFQAEKMGDVLKVIIGLASDVREEVYTATVMAQEIEGVSSRFLMSDAGHVVGKTIRSILSDADGFVDAGKIVDKMKGYEKIDDVIEHFASVVKKYGDELFPTIIQRAEAPKKIKELTAAGEEVPQRLRDLAKMPLRPDEYIFLRAEKFKKSSPVKHIDSFYAHVYMGASPGYYARNSINNFLTAFVDNPKTMWQTDVRAGETIRDLFGTEKIVKEGIGAVGQKVKKPTIFNYFMQKAADSETKASRRIIASSMRDTFSRMAPRAMQEIEKITTVPISFNSGLWDNISSIWPSKNYSVADTLTTLAEAQKTKVYDVYKSFNWVDDSVREGLEHAGLYDDLLAESGELLSKDEIKDFYDQKIQGVLDDAKLSNQEIGQVEYEVATAGDLAIREMPEGSDIKIGDDVRGFANTASSANVYAERKVRDAIFDIVQEASKDPTKSQIVEQVFRDTVDKIARELTTTLGSAPPAGGATSRSAVDFFSKITDEFHTAWRGRPDILIKPADVKKAASTNVVGFWDNYVKPFTKIDYPEGLSPKKAVDAYYNLVYYSQRQLHYANARDMLARSAGELMSGLNKSGVRYDMTAINESVNALGRARQYDNAIVSGVGNERLFYELGVDGKANYDRLKQLAHLNGLPPLEHRGKGQTFLNIINQYAEKIIDGVPIRGTDELVHTYKNAADVPSDVAEAAIEAVKRKGEYIGLPAQEVKAVVAKGDEALEAVEEVADWAAKGDNPPLNSSYHNDADTGITPFAAAQQTSKGIIDDLEKMRGGALANFGKTETYDAGFATAAESRKFYKELGNQLEEKLLDIRATAGEVAIAKRNFALLDYSDRRNVDTMLAMVYPFHYWHSRTYVNWLKRVVQKPGILAAYAHYKDTLGTIHAGQQDWWKYNINTNELLGMDAKNPLYFNLEATLNPLNGIMGVDFEDPKRRVNMMSAVLDDLSRMGPATWTPFSLAMATALDVQGEEEAAARWGSQIFQQTRAATSILSMIEDGASFMGVEFEGFGEGATKGLYEQFLDPYALSPVSVFSGGIDPYTRGRIGRAMASMQDEGFVLNGMLVTEEEYAEAARTQTGDVWTAAHRRAINERAPGQVSSFLMGVGFKGRTQSDIDIDTFYGEFYGFVRNMDNLSKEEVRQGFDQLRQQFPFMDTLLLARKGGDERDQAYAYSVLSRIPPGNSEIAKIAGLNPDILNKFYETKGKFAEWPEDEQLVFMGNMVTLGSILEIPSDGTRQEWTEARNQMTLLRDTMVKMFGDDIHTQIDLLYDRPFEEQDEWLAGHPAVKAALDWKASQIANAPESYAAAYYGGIDQIEKYYKGLMYNELNEKVSDYSELWDAYWAIPDKKERSKFWKANPGLQMYVDIRDKWDDVILKGMEHLGSRLQEGEPVQLRETDKASVFAQDVQEFVEAPPAISEQEIMIDALRFGGDALVDNIRYWQDRGSMSGTTQQALEAVAKRLGISLSELLEALR